MELFKSEEESELIDGSIIKYRIINIDEEITNENNISNISSNNIQKNGYTTIFAEVYLDSIHDCLKYICLRCKTGELSIDNIINHFKEFKNTCENIPENQQNFNDENKLGNFVIGNDFSILYSCSCCNLTLYNRSYIYPHLHQHLIKFKSISNQNREKANVCNVIENTIEPTFTDALLAKESAAPEERIVRNNLKSAKNIKYSKEKQQKLKNKKNVRCKKEDYVPNWRHFYSKTLKINLNKEPELNPYAQQFLKHLTQSGNIEFVHSKNSPSEEKSNPINLLPKI